MSEIPGVPFTVYPSTKLLKANYVLGVALLVAALVLYQQKALDPRLVVVIVVLAAIYLLWTAAKHAKRRFTRLSLDGDRLRLEDGMLNKTTRALNLGKIQDVQVEQGIWQRLFGVGSMTLQTAGESGRVTMENIDHPQEVADRILALARRQAAGENQQG